MIRKTNLENRWIADDYFFADTKLSCTCNLYHSKLQIEKQNFSQQNSLRFGCHYKKAITHHSLEYRG